MGTRLGPGATTAVSCWRSLIRSCTWDLIWRTRRGGRSPGTTPTPTSREPCSGSTTRRALERLKAGVPAIDAGGTDELDHGNGSLMRILPVAIFDPNLTKQDIIDYAMGAGCITYAHPRSQLVCSVYCSAARRLVEGQDDLPGILVEATRDVEAVAPDELLAELPGFLAYPHRNGTGYVV